MDIEGRQQAVVQSSARRAPVNAPGNFAIVVRMGFGEVAPRPHRLVAATTVPHLVMSSRSAELARPLITRSTLSRSATLPTRQGTQMPQDSSTKNCMKSRTTESRSRRESKIMTEPLQEMSS